jgi:hypothetical protein
VNGEGMIKGEALSTKLKIILARERSKIVVEEANYAHEEHVIVCMLEETEGDITTKYVLEKSVK